MVEEIKWNRANRYIIYYDDSMKVRSYWSLDKFTEIEQILKPMMTKMKTLMTLPQTYSNQFKIDGLRVQYTDGEARWTHYIFNFSIIPNQTSNFKLKISKTQFRNIMVGTVDYPKQKQQRQSWNSGNAMCYNGWKGRKYPEGGNQGDGFNQGDVVEVEVSRATSTIKYFVNGVLRATHGNNMLADGSRIFMPYVEMFNFNDSVEWLMW